jgi:hypothetical protein
MIAHQNDMRNISLVPTLIELGYFSSSKSFIMKLRGLKKQSCPPIIRWMGTGWGGEFDASASAQFERSSISMKCAEPLRAHKTDTACWYSGCVSNSNGIGLVVDQSRTPLFRCYNYDAYTNNVGNGAEIAEKHLKPNVLYSTRHNGRACTDSDGNLCYVTDYNQIASLMELHSKRGSYQSRYAEANVGNGKSPVIYKAVVVDISRGQETIDNATKMAELMKLPLIKMKGHSIYKKYL